MSLSESNFQARFGNGYKANWDPDKGLFPAGAFGVPYRRRNPMKKPTHAYATSGAFLSRHLEGLKLTPEEAATLTSSAPQYVEGMTRGNHPPSRRWMDRLDLATRRTPGKTWIAWLEMGQEVAQ